MRRWPGGPGRARAVGARCRGSRGGRELGTATRRGPALDPAAAARRRRGRRGPRSPGRRPGDSPRRCGPWRGHAGSSDVAAGAGSAGASTAAGFDFGRGGVGRGRVVGRGRFGRRRWFGGRDAGPGHRRRRRVAGLGGGDRVAAARGLPDQLAARAGPTRPRPTRPRRRLLRLELGLALDVDPPAGQAGGQPGVLALLADGERELEVVDDDRRAVPVLLVEADLFDPGRLRAPGRRTRAGRPRTGRCRPSRPAVRS